MQFLVNQELSEYFCKLLNLSSGFCRSWIKEELPDAHAISEEAFVILDYIQSELLRHKDDKKNDSNWSSHPLKIALSTRVGNIVNNATTHKQNFLKLSPGYGALPASVLAAPLTLEVALQKLKHRNPIAVNFSISSSHNHSLYVFTNAGMGKPDSIFELNIDDFCRVGKKAASAINTI